MNTIRSFTIHVTQEAISQAVKQDSRHCMIAEAIRLRGASSVQVTAEAARFNFEGTRYLYPLPALIRHKLIQFDEGKKIKPFEIKLNGNTGLVRPIYKRRSPGDPDAVKVKRRAPRKPMVAKHTTRRYQGLAMIQVKEE